jgi:hypothetical protein
MATWITHMKMATWITTSDGYIGGGKVPGQKSPKKVDQTIAVGRRKVYISAR